MSNLLPMGGSARRPSNVRTPAGSIYNKPGMSEAADRALIKSPKHKDTDIGRKALARLQQQYPQEFPAAKATDSQTALDEIVSGIKSSGNYLATPPTGGQISSASTTQTTGLVKDLENITSSNRGTETVTRGDAGVNEALRTLVGEAPKFLAGFTKDAAINDSQGAVRTMITEILNAGIPQINAEGTIAGGYDSTVTKLLTDNLTARAAREGAVVQQEAIGRYADITTRTADILNSVLSTSQNAISTGTSDAVTDESRKMDREVADASGTTNFGQTPEKPVKSPYADLIELMQLEGLFNSR